MKIEIKNKWNGNIIIAGEYESIKDALQKNRGADLRGADLGDADLRGANLGDANLRDANLVGANLRGAKGISIPIITIIGSKHTFFSMDGNIRIGCEKWPVDYWLKNYLSIGENNDYTPEEITEYKIYIDMIANLKKEKKQDYGL